MKLRHLRENISLDPKINDKIEAALAAYPKGMQTQLLDALDALKMAGEAGLSPVEWAAKVSELHPDVNMAELLKTVVKHFPFAVDRIGDRRYGYREDTLGGIDPQMAAAVKSQVKLASMAMQAMMQLGEFTQADLADRIAGMTGMDPDQADAYAEHFISQFLGGKVEAMGPDRFRVNTEPNKTSADHVNDLKDMIKNAGLDGKQTGSDVDEQVTQPQAPAQPQQATAAPAQTTSNVAPTQQLTPQQKTQQDQLINRIHKAVDGLQMTQASPDTIEKKLGTIHDDAAHRAMPLQDLAKVADQFEKIARDEQAALKQQGAAPKPQLTPQQQAQAAQQASTFESELRSVIKRAGI